MGNLVAWWKLNGDLLDYSGRGNHLTDSGESYETSMFGQGLTTNANAAVITGTSGDFYNLLSSWRASFTCWWLNHYEVDGTPYMWTDHINWYDGTYTRRFERGKEPGTAVRGKMQLLEIYINGII